MSRSDTGESTASIVARGDDAAWPFIKAELESGATLRRIPGLKRAYCDRGKGEYGLGISDARLRRLEGMGIIRFIGIDRYGLMPERGEKS